VRDHLGTQGGNGGGHGKQTALEGPEDAIKHQQPRVARKRRHCSLHACPSPSAVLNVSPPTCGAAVA